MHKKTVSASAMNQAEIERMIESVGTDGPVYIEQNGMPVCVMLSIEDYLRLAGAYEKNIEEIMEAVYEELNPD